MKRYTGVPLPRGGVVVQVRNGGGFAVSLRRAPSISHDFDWGYYGAGAAALAFSLLRDVAGKDVAGYYSSQFKEDVVAHWPHEGWQITSREIREWLELRRQEVEAVLAGHRRLLDAVKEA